MADSTPRLKVSHNSPSKLRIKMTVSKFQKITVRREARTFVKNEKPGKIN